MKNLEWYDPYKYYMAGQKAMIRKDKIWLGIKCLIIGGFIGLWLGYGWCLYHWKTDRVKDENKIIVLQSRIIKMQSQIGQLESENGLLKGKVGRIIFDIKGGIK